MTYQRFVVVVVVFANGSEPFLMAQSHLQLPRIFAVVVARRFLGCVATTTEVGSRNLAVVASGVLEDPWGELGGYYGSC